MSTRLNPDFVNELIFGAGGAARFTQDSPVLPNVWMAFGQAPDQPIDLLISPHIAKSAGIVGTELRERVAYYRYEAWDKRTTRSKILRAREAPRVAYNQFHVVARLYFDEVVGLVLPLTSWWPYHVGDRLEELVANLDDEANQEQLARDIDILFPSLERARESGASQPDSVRTSNQPTMAAPELLWLANIAGAVGWAQNQQAASRGESKADSTDERPLIRQAIDGPQLRIPDSQEIAAAVNDLLKLCRAAKGKAEGSVWSVNSNRRVEPSVVRSVPAIKADAARNLFDISCQDLTWAVLDSGIDAQHPAFIDYRGMADAQDPPTRWQLTRIQETYDFTRIRSLLDPLFLEKMESDDEPLEAWLENALEHEIQRRVEELRSQEDPSDDAESEERAEEKARARIDAKIRGEIAKELKDFERSLRKGRQINWGLLQPFLRMPHTDQAYERPESDHGTHVAGILAADVSAEGLGPDKGKDGDRKARISPGRGVCPDIRLIDFRVLGRDGDEFSVISALQFISWLNGHRDYLVVQGANLSLSIRHEVESFACGATPVCEEADRLVSSGVVVVAAAGNHGHQTFRTNAGPREGYLTVSITDPGNANKVITVGATHRSSPHTYGVSYFSSRGPTGDGRVKPDLVAPGEKIGGPVPGSDDDANVWARKDGTSMAAPHVSGAAALLIARHTELMGKSERVKKILCDTATDLGRERYFQGHGMVDVLRALQSV